MKELVFVTNNKHKLEEISHLLDGRIKLKGLRDLEVDADIPETEPTLEGNALLKARYIHDRFHVDCFADDTGLEIDALGGLPGVISARYAGPEQDFNANVEKVLDELRGSSNRKARFRTVIALILDEQAYFFEGIVNGHLLETRRGTGGFGYDPIFVPEGFRQTFAEMNLADKNRISHRGKAVEKLVEFLKARYL